MWLGEDRGELSDWTTQLWVKSTGKEFAYLPPWLFSPIGNRRQIGWDFFAEYSSENGLHMSTGAALGLMPHISALDSDTFDSSALAPQVKAFYEQTNCFAMEAWAEWAPLFHPFGRALNRIFARRLQQLNMPMRTLDTSMGFESEVSQIASETGNHLFSAWTRRLRATGNVIYAGAYGTCVPPLCGRPCVRVGFPLPNGNAVVIMRPSVDDQGGLILRSEGPGFGDAGFYFTLRRPNGTWSVKHLRSLREEIYVFEVENGTVRAEHVLTLFGKQFLRIHYKLDRRRAES